MRPFILFFLIIITCFAYSQSIDSLGKAKGFRSPSDFEKGINKYKILSNVNNEEQQVNIGKLIIVYNLYSLDQISKGDFNKADILLKQAEYFLKKYSLPNPSLRSYLYQSIGYNNLSQKKYNKANYYYQKALLYLPDSSYSYRSSTYRALADINFELGNLRKATIYYKKAINTLSKDFVYIDELSKTYQSYGYMLTKIGKIKEGEKQLNNAYEILLTNYGLKDYKTISASNYLANFYKSQNQFLKSIQFFHFSIIGIQEDFSDTNLYSNPELKNLKLNNELLYALKFKASAFYQLHYKTKDFKDLKASIETFQCAIALVEKAQNSYLNEESALNLSESYKSSIINIATIASHKAWELTQDHKYLELAFEFSEKGKASLLTGALSDYQKKSKSGVPKSLIQEEIRLKTEISLLKNKAETSIQNDIKHSTEKLLFEQMEALDSVQIAIKQKEQQLTITGPKDLKIVDIQKQLKDNEVLIEYSLTGYYLYTFCISKDTVTIHKQRTDSAFYAQLKILRTKIKSTEFEKSYSEIESFNNISFALYQKLIAPIEQQIKGRHLIIIPEEELLYLPFDLLCKEEWKEGCSFSELKYLILDYPISYHYAASLRFNTENRPEKDYPDKKGQFISYAPKYRLKKDHLKPLPYALKEVAYLHQVFGSDSINGQHANENHFKTHAQDYRYLHLSMHASIDDKNALFSKLHFTSLNDSTEDGALNISELYQLKLNNELVVLSGCSTGDGELHKGEGLYSLSRGFLQAGCPNITLTLWNINDGSSYEIIKSYYQYLHEGAANDVALQQAKVEYLNQASKLNSLPYFWAAYTIVGDNNLKIDTKGKFNYLFLLLFLPVSLLIIRRAKRKRQLKKSA